MLLASPKYAFKEAVLRAAPEDAGVYALYFGSDILYLGTAKGRGPENPDTIRARLLAHLHGELKPTVATHYAWEIHAFPEVLLSEVLAGLPEALPPYNQPSG